MSDQLKQIANQYLEQMEREKASERQYQLDVSNALLPDLMAEIAQYGEVRSFAIEPLDMPKKKQLQEKVETYWSNQNYD